MLLSLDFDRQGDLAIDMLLRLLSVTGSRTPMEYGMAPIYVSNLLGGF